MQKSSFCKFKMKRKVLLGFILLFIIGGTNQLIPCNQNLMRNFYLQGIRIAIVDKMYVCPHVHDKCCTLADEVKISHLWNKHTQPLIERYSGVAVANINSIVRNFFKMMSLDPELMILKYVVPREVPFMYKHCTTQKGLLETSVDKKRLKEYKTGFLKFLKLRVWKYKPRKRRRRIKIRGGFPKEGVKTYKNQTSCKTYNDIFFRDFIVVNQEKTEHCIGIHDKFMDFRVKDFISLLPNVKITMAFIGDIKKTLYCNLCNAHMHQYFDTKNKEIVLSKTFCRKLLFTKIDYFKFMHIIFIEFANELLQYQACFETNAKVFEFPYVTFITKYLRRIPLIKRCLNGLDNKKNFYKNCWMICELYKYYTFSPFFEGDIELFRRINVSLFSFMRKLMRAETVENAREKLIFKRFGIRTKDRNTALAKELLLPENIDGTLIEPLLLDPLNPNHLITNKHYYMSNSDMHRLLNKDMTSEYWVGYRSDQQKAFGKANLTYLKAKHKKVVTKLKNQIRVMKLKKAGNWVQPAKKKLIFPLKKPVKTLAGNVDMLSTVKFMEHMGQHLYPQRSLFMTRTDEAKPEDIVNQMNLSEEEKQEMIKSYGYAAPKERGLSLIDEIPKHKSRKYRSPRKSWFHRKQAKEQSRILAGNSPIPRKLISRSQRDYNNMMAKGEPEVRRRKHLKKTTIQKDPPKKPKRRRKGSKKKFSAKAPKDKKSTTNKHTPFEDFYSKTQTHGKRFIPKKKKKPYPMTVPTEPLHQIFERVQAKIDIQEFAHVYRKRGLDPLHNLELVNFRYNITRLIEMRYKLPEKLTAYTVQTYIALNKELIKDFNKDIDHEIEIYEDVNDIMFDVNRLKQLRKKLMKLDKDPILLHKINKEIRHLKKAAKANAARREIVRRNARKRKNMTGHTDLNHNKYPNYHHHHDFYFNDTFHGIQEMFTHIFGS